MLNKKSKMQWDRYETFYIKSKKHMKQYYMLFMDSTCKNTSKISGTDSHTSSSG